MWTRRSRTPSPRKQSLSGSWRLRAGSRRTCCWRRRRSWKGSCAAALQTAWTRSCS
nr:MAG TPA: hypothetical protein [Caudoviricetes sp.]